MADFTPGEIVLLAFPLADGSATKRRPALVLLDTGDADVVVARVTSQATRDRHDVTLSDWQKAGLISPSVVRTAKVATLEKRLVERTLGKLSSADWSATLKTIRTLCSSL